VRARKTAGLRRRRRAAQHGGMIIAQISDMHIRAPGKLLLGRVDTAAFLARAVAALGALVAILVGGLFEYNLGDSEVLMLGLLLTSLPFALRRERTAAAH